MLHSNNHSSRRALISQRKTIRRPKVEQSQQQRRPQLVIRHQLRRHSYSITTPYHRHRQHRRRPVASPQRLPTATIVHSQPLTKNFYSISIAENLQTLFIIATDCGTRNHRRCRSCRDTHSASVLRTCCSPKIFLRLTARIVETREY